jgi:hypothetical protein
MKTLRRLSQNRFFSLARIASASALVFAAGAMALLAVTAPTTYVSADQLDGTVNGAVSFSNTALLAQTVTANPPFPSIRTAPWQ